MKIVFTNVLVGAGVGGVDELLIWQDENGGRTENFRTWKDWGRIGMTVLGYLGMMTNTFAKIAEPVAQSATPLMTKTIIRSIRGAVGEEVTETASMRGAATKMRIKQTPKPGFEDVEIH